MVKRISRQASDLELGVRILWGAQIKITTLSMKNKVLTVAFFWALALPLFLFAEEGGLVPCEIGSCTICHLFELFVNVVQYFLTWIIPPVATIMFLWAGIVFYTSGGVPDKVNQAKDVIKYAVLGLVLIYSAWVIVGAFLSVMGYSGADSWYNWEIDCEAPEEE